MRARQARSNSERDAYAAVYRKAPPWRNFRSALERLGRGFWRLADHRRQRRCSAPTPHQPDLWRGGRRRLSVLALTVAGFALAGGGTSFTVANGGGGRSDLFQAGAFIRHNFGPPISPAPSPTAGRTSPPIAPSPLPASIACARNSTPTPSRAASKAAIALSAHGSAGSASRLTPLGSSPPSTCRPTPSKRFPAPTPSRWPMARRRHRNPQRTRFSRRQILCNADAILTLRGRAAWAHDFNPDRAVGRHLPDLAGRELRREWRAAGQRLRADHGLRRNQMDHRLVRCRHLRRRILQCHPLLRRQGRGAVCVVVSRFPAVAEITQSGTMAGSRLRRLCSASSRPLTWLKITTNRGLSRREWPDSVERQAVPMSRFGRISTRRATLLASTALALTGLTVAAIPPATAQDATWLNAPGSADYNDGANWTRPPCRPARHRSARPASLPCR